MQNAGEVTILFVTFLARVLGKKNVLTFLISQTNSNRKKSTFNPFFVQTCFCKRRREINRQFNVLLSISSSAIVTSRDEYLAVQMYESMKELLARVPTELFTRWLPAPNRFKCLLPLHDYEMEQPLISGPYLSMGGFFLFLFFHIRQSFR